MKVNNQPEKREKGASQNLKSKWDMRAIKDLKPIVQMRDQYANER